MKGLRLVTLAVFIGVLALAGLAMAETPDGCSQTGLNDNFGPSGQYYHIGETICYEITFKVDPNACDIDDALVTFWSPAQYASVDPDNICGSPDGAVLDPALYIPQTPAGDPPIVFSCGGYAALDYTVNAADVVLFGGFPAVLAHFCVDGDQLVGPPPLPEQDEKASINWVLAPCIEVHKEVCGYSKEGDPVTYTIWVKNCSDAPVTGGPAIPTTLYSVVVSDPLLGGDLAGFPSELAPGEESAHLTFDYTVQAGDPDPLENTVTATAEDISGFEVSDVASASVDLLHPGLEASVACQTPSTPTGAPSEFLITIENTGDVALDISTSISDDVADFQLAAGATETFTVYKDCTPPEVCYSIDITWEIPSEFCDLPNTDTITRSDCCSCCNPCIEITKSVDCDISKVGDDVIYTIGIDNCGNIELVDIVVTDPVLGDISGDFPLSLAAGDSALRAFTYTIVAGDEPGPVENIAHVDANGVCGDVRDPVSDDSELVVVTLIHPSFTVDKVCKSTEPTAIGGDVTFTITIENTGDCDLIINTDESEIPSDMLLAQGAPPYEKDVTVSDAQPPCEFNKVIVTVTIPPEYCELANVLIDSAEACCPVECDPCIEITKFVDCDISKVGDDVIYTIGIDNCGDVELVDIVVTDPVLGDISGDFPLSLAAGDSALRAFTYTIVAGDEPGPVENIAHVDANGVCGDVRDPVSDDSELVVVTLIHPSFTVDKVCKSTEPTAIGGDVTFTITIENTGDCDLIINTDESEIPSDMLLAQGAPPYEKDVTVSGAQPPCEFNKVVVTVTIPPEYCELANVLIDSAEVCCPVECDPCIEITKFVDCDISKVGDDVIYTIGIDNCGDVELVDIVVTDPVLGDISDDFPLTLAVGDSALRAFTYTIVAGDEPGPVENIAHVDANGVCGDVRDPVSGDSELITVTLIHPSFTVEKVCKSTEPTAIGGDVTFTITIENTGDCDLIINTDESEIPSDMLLAQGAPPYEKDVTVSGAQPPCEFNKVVVTVTIPPEYCELANVLIDSAEVCCPVECDPCIEITKFVDCDISKVGDDVIYTIGIDNCGDVELVDIVVTDPVLGDISDDFPLTLAVGDSALRAFTYTIVAGDEPGPVENIAHVDANGVCGDAHDPVSGDSELITVTLIHPSFTVEKVCVDDPLQSGATEAWYTVTITNTGDVALDISTDDGDIGSFTLADGDAHVQNVSEPVPAGVGEVCNKIVVTATIPPEFCDLQNVYVDSAEACCEVAGEHGCTPGYWKNQTECWECYTTSTPLCDVFTFPAGVLYDYFCTDGFTLHKALKFGGGEGVVGKARNLMRHGVAALLNACDSDVSYGMNPAGVITMVNDALATEDEDEITSVKNQLAAWNERGCSQDADCNPQDPEDGPGGAPGQFTPSDPGVIPVESRNSGDQGMLESGIAVPREFSVRGVPNPAGTSASIRYALPMDSKVTVEILDIQGRLVTKLVDQHMPAGSHTVAWDGDGSPAGVYFCKVQCCDGKETVSKVIKVQ